MPGPSPDPGGVLNPTLADHRFCPRCGAEQELEVRYPRSEGCLRCGYRAYYNPKPVAAVIPRTADGAVWLLRRGFAPGAGLWTFPGGFVDLGESVEQAAVRETREELACGVELERLVGVYSRDDERVVLVVYAGRLTGEPSTTPEATEIRAVAPAEVPWDEIAFWSTRAALRDELGLAG